MDESKRVFLSYAHEDEQSARQLYTDLINNSITVWFDKVNLLPGQKWRIEIQKAIKNSNYFLILLSSNSVTKPGYVQKEVKIALDILDEFTEGDIFIIPIRLNECVPNHENLKELQWVDMFPSWENGIKKISEVIKQELEESKNQKDNRSAALISDDDYMGKLLEHIVKSLIDHHPEELQIWRDDSENSIIYEMRIPPGNLGRIIGKKGQTIKAIRIIMAGVSSRLGKRCLIEVWE